MPLQATTNMTVVVTEFSAAGFPQNTMTFQNLTVNLQQRLGCAIGQQGCLAWMGFTGAR